VVINVPPPTVESRHARNAPDDFPGSLSPVLVFEL
jgi:hypothetical protein